MRYEAKSVEEAVEGAARALGKTTAELKYTVIRDEKSFWGGRVVEIEVEEGGAGGGRSRPPVDDSEEPTLGPEIAPEKETPLPTEAFGAVPSTRSRARARTRVRSRRAPTRKRSRSSSPR